MHDVGHGPFSHLFESIIKKINPGQDDPHEKISQIIIREDPDLDTILGNKKNDVIDVLRNDPSKYNNPKSLHSDIVSGGLDADKLDYLRRDSHHIGVAYGQFDLARILHNLSTTRSRSRVLIDQGGKDALENYRLARYLMHVQVYEHHARLAADSMFKQALNIAIHDENVIEKERLKFCTSGDNEDFLDFYKTLDDYSIYQMIIANEKSKTSREILLNIKRRKLLKRACEFTPAALENDEDVGGILMKMSSEELDNISSRIANSLHLKSHEVIFHRSKSKIKLYQKGEILFRHKNKILDLANTSPFTLKKDEIIKYYVYGPSQVETRKHIVKKTMAELGLETCRHLLRLTHLIVLSHIILMWLLKIEYMITPPTHHV